MGAAKWGITCMASLSRVKYILFPMTEQKTASIILIVDDEPTARQTVELILENQGYQIEMAENGIQAISQALAPRRNIIGCNDARTNGFDVCRRIGGTPAG